MKTPITIVELASRAWRRGDPPDAAADGSTEGLERRVKHLESELEGLQDAVHRQAVLNDERIDDLRRRMEPAQLARDLSEDARSRGLS